MAKPTAELELNPLDLERERKRVRSVLRTPEGLQALRDVLGYNFVLAGEAREQEKPIIAILTPSHKGFQPESGAAMQKMLLHSQQACVVMPEPIISASIVHWVRNDLVGSLYKSCKPFDYVLLMDDDMVPEQDALLKLLAHKKPIVAAGCTVRMDPPRPNFCIWEPDTMTFRTCFEWSGQGLIPVGSVGTGFMLVSREALEKIADYYLTCQHEQKYFGMPKDVAEKISERRFKYLEESFNAWWFETLKQPLGGGEFGEDMSFCFKARECGIPVYVDTTVKVGHIGHYAYSLDDYWDYQAGLLKEETHRQMLCAAIGKEFQMPKVEQGVQPTGKISVLIPSRGRPEMLRQTVESLLRKATGEVEVLVRLDYDDPDSKRLFLVDVPGETASRMRVFTGPSHGYRGMHLYNNELAEHATGDWLMMWSDDTVIDTPGWDEKIRTAGGGLKVLHAGVVTPEGKDYRLNLFPITSRKLYEVLGHLSLQTHGDSWMQVIARVCGIEQRVELDIRHLREEIDDNTKKTSLATYRESSPEFFSPKFQELLYQDVMTVKQALAALKFQ